MDIVPIAIAAVGLLIAGSASFFVTRAAASGALALNPAMGIRTKITTSSQAAWEVSHRAALPLMKAAWVVSAVAAVLSVAAAVAVNRWGLHVAVPVIGIVGGYALFLGLAVASVRAAHRAVKQRR